MGLKGFVVVVVVCYKRWYVSLNNKRCYRNNEYVLFNKKLMRIC
uniref:Uncharacterized protein n=1 Tax=Arundo donax TaxID=35708 RepID=A0A0A9AQU5_ARUDO